MRSRNVGTRSGSPLMGLAVGVAVGLAAGLLAAPLRGSAMRAAIGDRAADGGARLQSMAWSMRGWTVQAIDRCLSLVEEGRRAFITSPRNASRTGVRITEPEPLSATLGEIASVHDGSRPSTLGASS